MYLGIVRKQKIQSFSSTRENCGEFNQENYLICSYIDFCNQDNRLETITIVNQHDLFYGDLVVLCHVVGKWVAVNISNELNKKGLSTLQLLQLSQLIEQERVTLNEENKMSKHNKDSLDIYSRKEIIRILLRILNKELSDENKRDEFNKLRQNSIQKQYMEVFEKMIIDLKLNQVDLFKWIMYANSILHLMDNNNVDRNLLINIIECLLDSKTKNNEVNELKLELEQQLKEMLHELKGKQKKLV